MYIQGKRCKNYTTPRVTKCVLKTDTFIFFYFEKMLYLAYYNDGVVVVISDVRKSQQIFNEKFFNPHRKAAVYLNLQMTF
jgi:hypothetical protein